MELPSQTVVDVLSYLLPGFIAAAIVYNLTPAHRPAPFERVVQALIFTIVVQVSVAGVRGLMLFLGGKVGNFGYWSTQMQLAWSVLLAIVIGLGAAYAIYTTRIHDQRHST